MKEIQKELAGFTIHLRLANFKDSTVQAYTRTLEKFFEYCASNYKEEELGQDHVQSYLLMRLEKGKSWSTINADYSSLRKYFKVIRDYEWSLKKLPRPRKDHRLPSILSKEEVALLINSAPNFKYQVFLSLLYGTGVRLSEACHIKIEDIDSNRMQIRIHQGKGGKDRFVLIPPKLLVLLRKYYLAYRPVHYLFNGRRKGDVYSASAGQWSIKRARAIAGITKKCSIHTLRHCFATHHLELGTDLVYLKEQMGHKHLKTTARYISLCLERYRQINHPIEVINLIFYPKKIR